MNTVFVVCTVDKSKIDSPIRSVVKVFKTHAAANKFVKKLSSDLLAEGIERNYEVFTSELDNIGNDCIDQHCYGCDNCVIGD